MGGDSIETAIPIHADNGSQGVAMEYIYIQGYYDALDWNWELVMQGLREENQRYYDVLEVETASGQRRLFCFDITGFYGNNYLDNLNEAALSESEILDAMGGFSNGH